MPSAQRVQWAKIRITVVIVSALSILAVLIYLLSGGRWLKPKTYLVTYISDATGLGQGSDVELNGVSIGTVESLRLTHSKDPNRVIEVRMKVQQEFLRHIPADSIITLDSETMLGDKYVAITMGKSPQPVRPGGELRFRPPTNLAKTIDITQFEAQLRSIDQIIRDIQEGNGPLGEFVTTDTMYRQVLNSVGDLESGLRAATNTESRLGHALYSAEEYQDISTFLSQLHDRLEQLQASSYIRNSAQYDGMRDQITRVRQMLADLNAGKGAGGQFVTSDASYRAWNRQLTAWIASVDALNAGEGSMGQMLVNAQAYESLNGTVRNLQTTLKEFREDPRKFLRLKIF